MTNVYANHKPNQTPQTEPLDDSQIKNAAGGYVFVASEWQQYRRFLILGTQGGTYYADGAKLTADNAKNINKVFNDYGPSAVAEIVKVSVGGEAPKVQPALFALAVASAHPSLAVRSAAFNAIPEVCRTFTHLAEFVEFAKNFRSIGTGLQKAIARWYTEPTVDALSYQVVKYRNRHNWTHRDMLRVAHPTTNDPARKQLFDYICERPANNLPETIQGFEAAQAATNVPEVVSILREYKLPWETIPTQFHNEKQVWETIFDNGQLGLTALIRQLPRLTNLGVDRSRYAEIKHVLTDEDALRKARIHPLTALNALMAYRTGKTRSGVTFTPNAKIIDLLDEAFYASIGYVEPTGKRICLALDVSGSMGWETIAGMSMTPAEASTALALVTAKTEDNYEIMAFSSQFKPLPISPRQRLDDALRVTSNCNFGGTDCAVPMNWAKENKLEFDAFVVYTDNETWAGYPHPAEALGIYRRASGIEDSKLVVVGMTATDCSIADADDENMLDIAGFSTSTPDLISGFIKG